MQNFKYGDLMPWEDMTWRIKDLDERLKQAEKDIALLTLGLHDVLVRLNDLENSMGEVFEDGGEMEAVSRQPVMPISDSYPDEWDSYSDGRGGQ